jgi:hypothetical protein
VLFRSHTPKLSGIIVKESEDGDDK